MDNRKNINIKLATTDCIFTTLDFEHKTLESSDYD